MSASKSLSLIFDFAPLSLPPALFSSLSSLLVYIQRLAAIVLALLTSSALVCEIHQFSIFRFTDSEI